MNAAACVVSDSRKYDRGLTSLLHDKLVSAAQGTTVYMIDCCVYTSDIGRRQHLRSAGCRQLLVPRHRRSMLGRRAFSVAGPAAWNSLPDYLRDPTRSVDSFRRDLKTLLFSFY